MAERVNPITLTDTETGERYTLEFSRETVKFAQNRKFAVGDIGDFPMLLVPELFYLSFRMHHKNLSRAQTDKILETDLGGLTKEFIERLLMLYNAPHESLIRDEDDAGNSKMTVEM